MKKIIIWFRDKYIDLLFWWHKNKLERELEKEFRLYSFRTIHEIYQDDTERKYTEGIAIVKQKVNTMAKDGNYEQVLKDVKDLIHLATEETSSQRVIRETLTSLSRLPEKSRKQMIKDRIQHYEELRKYNEQRALIKQVKQARKEGKTELAEKLEKEWRNKYGKIRNPG